jgi:hypothetical protein
MAVGGKPLKWFPGFEATLNPNLKVGENETRGNTQMLLNSRVCFAAIINVGAVGSVMHSGALRRDKSSAVQRPFG